MPRKQTNRIVERKKVIFELLTREGELPTNEIVRKTNLSHSQVFYALKLLQKDGLVKEVKRGKVAYWRTSEVRVRRGEELTTLSSIDLNFEGGEFI